MRSLQSSKENRVRFIRLEGKGVMTAPGVQGSETIFKTMDLTEEIGWGKRNVKLRVISKLLLRNRESGSKTRQ